MDKLTDLFSFLRNCFRWYFIVMPWEQAIFIRGGRKHRVLGPGLYFRIPFIDMVYINTTRRRMIEAPMQTVTTSDGHAITIKTGVSYRIVDMFKLYNGLYHPENTLLNIVMSDVSRYVSDRKLHELSPNNIESAMSISAQQDEWGLGDLKVTLNNYAVVKTFRLIQDQSGFYSEQLKMNHIDYQEK